ncbi:MAG: hypothetical protein EBT92_07745 [Planctomycetes bacterium]|nr:hypothetical protein [Planctomycetota bacterium]
MKKTSKQKKQPVTTNLYHKWLNFMVISTLVDQLKLLNIRFLSTKIHLCFKNTDTSFLKPHKT